MYVGTIEIDSRVIVMFQMFMALSSPFSSQRTICSFPRRRSCGKFTKKRNAHTELLFAQWTLGTLRSNDATTINENVKKKKRNCRLHELNNNFARASHTVQLFAVFAKWVGIIAVKTERTQFHFLKRLSRCRRIFGSSSKVPVVF